MLCWSQYNSWCIQLPIIRNVSSCPSVHNTMMLFKPCCLLAIRNYVKYVSGKYIKLCIIVINISIQRWIIPLYPYRVLTYVPTCIRVVISKPVIVQSRLLVLTLSQLPKWHESPVAPEVEQVAINVVVGLPDERSVFVVGLHGATDVVAHDAVTLAVYQLGGWDIAVCVVNPGLRLSVGSGLSNDTSPFSATICCGRSVSSYSHS